MQLSLTHKHLAMVKQNRIGLAKGRQPPLCPFYSRLCATELTH